MSKLIPFVNDECDLTLSNFVGAENLNSQQILSQIYQIAKKIASSRHNIQALVQNGRELTEYIQVLHDKGLDESTLLNTQVNEQGKREAGAWSCVICGALLKLGLNDAIYKRVDIADYMTNQFCKLFPKQLNGTCNQFLKIVGPYLVEAAANKYNSDVICAKIGACDGKYLQCHINGTSNPNPQSSQIEEILSQFKTEQAVFQSPWQWIVELFNNFANDHLPVVDLDNDGFSTIPTMRGYNWRGYDCNDFQKDVRPGVKNYSGDQTIDYNCNGIWGVDTVSGKPYKEVLCGNSEQYGIVTMGDSAGAHFEIPPAYLNVTLWNEKPFSDILTRISDEFDLPHKSGTTGYEFNQPFVNSLYKKLLEQNRCIRNDYQNLGVNGAMSTDSLKNIKALRRNQTTDYPLWIVFELIGNDVCDPAHSFDAMTPPQVFREKILEIWNYLDTVVPAGSHMIIWGVADGKILYDTLKNKLEPIGITYPNFYDYLNCLGISPCWGYMNSDATTRDLTADWAASLNQVYKDLLADPTIKFNNFDLVYYDLPIQQIIDMAIANGYTAQDIIEPVDGFHPSQLANDYLADIFWANIKRDRPDWIPLKNPKNNLIDQLFGNPFANQNVAQAY
ncbi:hypothetical protein ABPG73_014879 [Tetrahymena malaccensis]